MQLKIVNELRAVGQAGWFGMSILTHRYKPYQYTSILVYTCTQLSIVFKGHLYVLWVYFGGSI